MDVLKRDMKAKCLSVKNPISYLICAGIKDVENRSWKTSYRGDLYIHSSGLSTDVITFRGLPDAIVSDYKNVLDTVDENGHVQYGGIKNAAIIKKIVKLQIKANGSGENCLPYIGNAIIGKVTLSGIVKNSKSIWAENGMYHWILKNPVLFDEPILYITGKLRLWDENLDIGGERDG